MGGVLLLYGSYRSTKRLFEPLTLVATFNGTGRRERNSFRLGFDALSCGHSAEQSMMKNQQLLAQPEHGMTAEQLGSAK